MNHPASTLKFDFPSLEIRPEFINVFIYEFKSQAGCISANHIYSF